MVKDSSAIIVTIIERITTLYSLNFSKIGVDVKAVIKDIIRRNALIKPIIDSVRLKDSIYMAHTVSTAARPKDKINLVSPISFAFEIW